MSKPLLLHALSVKDRMLEPNELPLHGRVWAFSKEECGREAFVSYCLAVMANLDMKSGKGMDLSLRRDVIAFDAENKSGTYTIVISLADDSLASDYFYFLGLWQRSEGGLKKEGAPKLPEDKEMLQPTFQYEVLFSDKQFTAAHAAKWLKNEGYRASLYDGLVNIAGNADFSGSAPARFILSPSSDKGKLPKTLVRHALYSLRNLMALSGAAQRMYHSIWSDSIEVGLQGRVGELAQAAVAEKVPAEKWDEMVRSSGDILFQASEMECLRASQGSRLQGVNALFHCILDELHHCEHHGMAPLWPRLLLSIELVEDLMDEREATLKRTEKLAAQVLQVLQARIMTLGKQPNSD